MECEYRRGHTGQVVIFEHTYGTIPLLGWHTAWKPNFGCGMRLVWARGLHSAVGGVVVSAAVKRSIEYMEWSLVTCVSSMCSIMDHMNSERAGTQVDDARW